MKNWVEKLVDLILSRTEKVPVIKKIIDRNIILYGIIGVTGVIIDLAIFTFLVKIAGLYFVISNIISVSMGLINNFLLNRRFNFKVYNKPLKRFFSFYIIGFIGIALSTLIIHILVEYLNLAVVPAKMIAVVIVVVLQYIANKYVTFRHKKAE